MTLKRTHFVLTSVLLGSVIQPAIGAMYYVSRDGSDRNSGTATAPFATPQKAANVVRPGDTVIVREGVYTDHDSDGYVISLLMRGREGAWITFKADNGARVVVDGAGSAQFGIVIKDTYIHVEGFEIRGATKSGIRSYESHNIAIVGNEIHHNGNPMVLDCEDTYGRAGINMSADTSHFLIDRNAIHDNGRAPNPRCEKSLLKTANPNYRHDHGIYAMGSRHLIQNNIFWSHAAGFHIKIDGFWGEKLSLGEFSHIVTNNSFGRLTRPDTEAGGVVTPWNNEASSGTLGTMKAPRFLLQNNVFHEPQGPARQTAVRFFPGKIFDGHVIRNNVTTSRFMFSEDLGTTVTAAVAASANSVRANPLIKSVSPYDFRLEAGSPAVASGIMTQAPKHDHDSAIRQGDKVDMGAFAYSGSAGSPLLAPTNLQTLVK